MTEHPQLYEMYIDTNERFFSSFEKAFALTEHSPLGRRRVSPQMERSFRVPKGEGGSSCLYEGRAFIKRLSVLLSLRRKGKKTSPQNAPVLFPETYSVSHFNCECDGERGTRGGQRAIIKKIRINDYTYTIIQRQSNCSSQLVGQPAPEMIL